MFMDIASRLDRAMKAADVRSQSQLARISGVPQPTINRILKGAGKQGPETVTLTALAAALNVELRWLQQGVGPQRISRVPSDPALDLSPSDPRLAAPRPEPALQWVTPREAELLSEFRQRTVAHQDMALAGLRGLPRVVELVATRNKA
jgi:transcriptional regulator with XRE-family HTH domain